MAGDTQGDERAAETRVDNTVVDPGGQSPLDAQRRAEEPQDAYSERPHLYVAGAFVGGLVFAQVLKRLGGGDGE
jgi:hypothetical protein